MVKMCIERLLVSDASYLRRGIDNLNPELGGTYHRHGMNFLCLS